MGTIESGRMLQVHLVKPGATKRLRTCSPSTLKIPWTTGPVLSPGWTKHASTLRVSLGQSCLRLDRSSASTVCPNSAVAGLLSGRLTVNSSGDMSEPWTFEKWLWVKPMYVRASANPDSLKVTSAPPEFKSARNTERLSLSLRTALSAAPTLWCCWGFARRTLNV